MIIDSMHFRLFYKSYSICCLPFFENFPAYFDLPSFLTRRFRHLSSDSVSLASVTFSSYSQTAVVLIKVMSRA